MLEPLLIIVGMVGFVGLMSIVLRPKPNPDEVDKRLLADLEDQVKAELTDEMKSALYVELSKVTTIATAAAQQHGLSEKEFLRFYRKGAIQVHMTALFIAREPSLNPALAAE